MYCTYLNARYTGILPLTSNMFDDHIGLVVGHTYTIQVCQKFLGRSLKATPCHGFDLKPMADMTITYPDLEHLFRDWQPLQLLRNPDAPYVVNKGGFHDEA